MTFFYWLLWQIIGSKSLYEAWLVRQSQEGQRAK